MPKILQGLRVARDRTLVVRSRKNARKKLHISSSFAKILEETNSHAREIPRSGSKATDGKEKREKEKKRD